LAEAQAVTDTSAAARPEQYKQVINNNIDLIACFFLGGTGTQITASTGAVTYNNSTKQLQTDVLYVQIAGMNVFPGHFPGMMS